MIKVIHIITNLQTGGAEMMLYKLLDRIDDKRFESSVISLVGMGTMGQRIKALGVPVYSLGMSVKLPSISAFWRLAKLIRTNQPDIIQGWMYHGNLAATLSRFLISKDTIVLWNIRHSLHNIKYEKKLTALLIRIGSILSKSKIVKKIVYNSKISANQHEVFGYAEDCTIVIPNGFDCERFKPSPSARKTLREKLKISRGDIVIGLVARFHPMKDHANYFNAAKILLTKNDKVHFVLVGRNVDESNSDLLKLIKSSNLRKKLSLLGERKDTQELTAGFDIACSSSSYGEAFPNVIGEAMACGVPCVVTDVGDSAWIVDRTGIAVPPRSAESLANAWAQLIKVGNQERTRLGAKARKRILEQFSLDNIVNQYEKLYKNIIRKCK